MRLSALLFGIITSSYCAQESLSFSGSSSDLCRRVFTLYCFAEMKHIRGGTCICDAPPHRQLQNLPAGKGASPTDKCRPCSYIQYYRTNPCCKVAFGNGSVYWSDLVDAWRLGDHQVMFRRHWHWGIVEILILPLIVCHDANLCSHMKPTEGRSCEGHTNKRFGEATLLDHENRLSRSGHHDGEQFGALPIGDHWSLIGRLFCKKDCHSFTNYAVRSANCKGPIRIWR